MRDAFGGVFMFNLFIVFIFIYTAFAAISLTYAKAFRLKNSLISFVEENEIITLSNFKNKYEDQLNTILGESSYYKTCDSIGYNETQEIIKDNKTIEYCQGGVVFRLISQEEVESTGSYLIKYEVVTYADWNLGVLNKLLALGGQSEDSQSPLDGAWAIKGEAQVIQRYKP